MSSPFDSSSLRSNGTSTVVDDLRALVRDVINFGTTVGASVSQLDSHVHTLDAIRKTLDRLEEEKKRDNDLRESELKLKERAGGRDHEFRMRILHGFGGLLTGSVVPALLYYFLGYSADEITPCPEPEVHHVAP